MLFLKYLTYLCLHYSKPVINLIIDTHIVNSSGEPGGSPLQAIILRQPHKTYETLASSSLSPHLFRTSPNKSTCFESVGSSFTTLKASSLASARILASRIRFANLNSGNPDCFVPRKSPGPRIIRSASAILNPSEVFSMTESRLCASSVLLQPDMNMHIDSCSPLPILPLS